MDKLLASWMFFTRLPWWRIKQVPTECFKHIVAYWPYAGWITGGAMAGMFCLCGEVFSPTVSVVAALITRLLLTGALHEDGLADCCDGFGGGTGRDRTLAIMKDPHIGSYGVIGLISYFLLWVLLVADLPYPLTAPALLVADVWSKTVASHIINVLPYARKAEESKSKTVYERMTGTELLWGLLGGCAAWAFLPIRLWAAALAPIVVFGALCVWMRRRLDGYTGDCCGATFLLCELAFYAGLHIILAL